MLIIICFLFIHVTFGIQSVTHNDYGNVSTAIDILTDQSAIDEAWMSCMITAPATINLLGSVMVVASRVDVSFEQYSPNHVYKYIKYPKSFRATLLQISNGKFFKKLNNRSNFLWRTIYLFV